MSPDLFREAFFFFTRHEAGNLRTVCRTFNALCTGLRDVHGYKLQVDLMSIGCTEDWPAERYEYYADVYAYDRLRRIEGSVEEVAAGLKPALAVSLVHHGYIYTSALGEGFCGDSVAFFSGVSVETVEFIGRLQAAYYETVASSKLHNFLLSFDAIGELQFHADLLEADLTDDFILRCRAKRMRTLQLTHRTAFEAYDFQLQEGSEDELLQHFLSMKPSFISATR
ncbi:hypothetical protein AAVH_20958 [Aphelenchoides avenae]|nr:hypothetical protein AAVH_20958 [Aphelenchus avenae]